jgi:hypothetical protein
MTLKVRPDFSPFGRPETFRSGHVSAAVRALAADLATADRSFQEKHAGWSSIVSLRIAEFYFRTRLKAF